MTSARSISSENDRHCKGTETFREWVTFETRRKTGKVLALSDPRVIEKEFSRNGPTWAMGGKICFGGHIHFIASSESSGV